MKSDSSESRCGREWPTLFAAATPENIRVHDIKLRRALAGRYIIIYASP